MVMMEVEVIDERDVRALGRCLECSEGRRKE